MPDHIEVFLAATANSPAPENIERTLVGGVTKARYQQTSAYNGDDPTPIWGIRESMADRYGDKMDTGDLLLFYTGRNDRGIQEYAYMATIQDTECNQPLAEDIWVDENGEGGVEWPFIIFLSNSSEVHIPIERLHTDLGYAQSHLQSFRRVTDNRIEPNLTGTTRKGYLLGLTETNEQVSGDALLSVNSTNQEGPPVKDSGAEMGMEMGSATVLDEDERSTDLTPPERRRTEVSRIIRNTALVKQLKKEHNYECQVCGDIRYGPHKQPYAEGHHLHPLGEDGRDDEENILVLCPNHHSDFDYGLVKIDPDTYDITHKYETGHGSLRMVPGHDIGVDHIVYNNENVANF